MKKIFFLLMFLAVTFFTNAQNVGIGTTTPTARLHVKDSAVLFSAIGDIPGTPGLPPQQGAGRRMMWYPNKAAFRVGYVTALDWDKDSIGNFSFASGNNSKAKGDYSTAMGTGTNASGIFSTAIGIYSNASGPYSTAIGYGANASGDRSLATGYQTNASGTYSTTLGYTTFAKAVSSLTIGNYNNTDDNPSSTIIDASDRIFQIGNGTAINPSNAMTVLRNGNAGIGIITPSAKLSISANGTELTGTAASNTFKTLAGTLPATAGSELGLASFGFASTNNSSLGIRAYRTSAGADWTTTSLLLEHDVDNTKRVNSTFLALGYNGNIGIGTFTPGFPLSFAPTTGDKISLWSNSTDSYGFGIQSTLLQIHSDISAADIGFGYGSSASFTENMRIKGNGNVGIGTINPGAKLHISAGDASLALVGPNSYGAQLYVGASPANYTTASTAQVLASDGNLHLDPATGKNMYIGYYQARDIFLNPNGGKVGIGTTAPTATLEVNGYTKLGSDAPSIKVKKLTGTTSAAEGGFVNIASGVTSSKILSVSVMVSYNTNAWIGPYYGVAGYNFRWVVAINGSISVENYSGDSASILSKPITILITYEE